MSHEAWRYDPSAAHIVAEEVDTDDPAEAARIYARLRTEATRVYRVAEGQAVLVEKLP